MKKFKLFFDMDKEERWLNEQLQKGYRCTNISSSGTYTFEKTDKNYVMRIDYQDFLSKKKFEEYKGMYEDFGWMHLKRHWLGGVQYWQKIADDQSELFSDRQSKSNYYKKLMNYSFMLALFFLAFSYTSYNNSGLYHEGLWNMSGSLFWKAFLFETPFVLLKLLPTFLFILFGWSFYKFYRKYSILKGN